MVKVNVVTFKRGLIWYSCCKVSYPYDLVFSAASFSRKKSIVKIYEKLEKYFKSFGMKELK